MSTHYTQKFASTADFIARSPDRSLAAGIGDVSGVLYHNVAGVAVAILDDAATAFAKAASYAANVSSNTNLFKASATISSSITATGGLNAIRGEAILASGQTLSGTSFFSGIYGRANIFGTVAIGSGDLSAVMGKMDLNGSTLTSGHIAPVQSNIVNPPASALTTVDLFYGESAGGNPINSMFKAFGKATYVLDLESNVHTQMSTTGTAGATSAKGWLKVLVDGVVRYIPLTDSVS